MTITQKQWILLVVAAGILFWISVVIYRERQGKDVECLRRPIVRIGSFSCNGWCTLHFLQYMLMGFLAPSYWKWLILMGIGFELIEIPLSKMSQFIDSKLIADTLTNTLGILTGVILRKTIST